MANVTLDVERSEVKVNGREVGMTLKEKRILEVLVKADGRVVSREALMSEVWGTDYLPGDSRTVDQHIARLRGHLKECSSAVVTVVGEGYKAVGVKMAQPPLCPMALVQKVTRGDFGTRAEVIWKGQYPKVKKGTKLAEVA